MVERVGLAVLLRFLYCLSHENDPRSWSSPGSFFSDAPPLAGRCVAIFAAPGKIEFVRRAVRLSAGATDLFGLVSGSVAAPVLPVLQKRFKCIGRRLDRYYAAHRLWRGGASRFL